MKSFWIAVVVTERSPRNIRVRVIELQEQVVQLQAAHPA